jgi:hypothetical protein
MSSIHFTNTFKEASTKILEHVYVKEGLENPTFWKEVFNTPDYDAKLSFFQNHSLIPLGLLAPVGEGGVPDLDYASPEFTMMFTWQDFGLRYVITRRASIEDPKAIFNKMPRMLRRSVDETLEYLFFNNLNLSFLNKAQGGYNVDDGLSLINAAHPITGMPGVTQSNFLGNVAFTVESLQAVITMFALTRDPRGKLIRYIPKNIIYPPGYHQQVTEILQTNVYPSTDQNRINVVSQQRTKLEPIEVPYLNPNQGAGPFPWWVATGKGSLENSHSMFAAVKENRQRTYVDVQSESIFHEARVRISNGVDSWRGIVGSQGA